MRKVIILTIFCAQNILIQYIKEKLKVRDKEGLMWSSFAYSIFLYLGMGTMYPWNVFINAGNYWEARFCGTIFQATFENYFSITSTISQIIGLILSIFYQDRLSINYKIAFPYILYAIIFLFSALLVLTDIDHNLLFFITFCCNLLCGFIGALLSGGLFGYAAHYPAYYTGAIMTGQGLAGLSVSISDILTLLAQPPTDTCSNTPDNNTLLTNECNAYKIDISALIYFLLATVVLLSCAWAFLALKRLHIARYV